MDYENMSDFEINKAVAEALGFTVRQESHSETVGIVWVARESKTEWRGLPDYCNNPGDAWPIIVENKIGGHWGKAAPGAYFAVSRLEEFVVMDKNPLRAVCIVYLMMQEAK